LVRRRLRVQVPSASAHHGVNGAHRVPTNVSTGLSRGVGHGCSVSNFEVVGATVNWVAANSETSVGSSPAFAATPYRRRRRCDLGRVEVARRPGLASMERQGQRDSERSELPLEAVESERAEGQGAVDAGRFNVAVVGDKCRSRLSVKPGPVKLSNFRGVAS
jgi:hypothetical protein